MIVEYSLVGEIWHYSLAREFLLSQPLTPQNMRGIFRFLEVAPKAEFQ